MDLFHYCDICGEGHPTEKCPELGLDASTAILDQISTRARLTLPSFVEVVDNGIGLVGVVAKEIIQKKTQFGPYEAKRTTHVFDDSFFFTLKLIGKDGSTVCLDTTDENECNWLCLVRAAVSSDHQNLMAYQLGTNIYFSTMRDIGAGEELQVWYAPHFAKKLGKPSTPDGVTKVLLGHRIEPLLTDVLGGGEVDMFTQPNTGVSSLEEMETDNSHAVVRRAIYCPRCGNTFSSQNDMVQHLREHVLSKTGRGLSKPKRGRPRIHPLTEEHKPDGVKRGRGRPRKTTSTYMPYTEHGVTASVQMSNSVVQTYERKHKLSDDDSEAGVEYDLSDSEENEEEENIENTYSNLVIDEGDDDKDYHPQKEVKGTSLRIQPRRSRKGKHSKFDEDFVLGKVVKKVRRHEAAKDRAKVASTEISIDKSVTQSDVPAVLVNIRDGQDMTTVTSGEVRSQQTNTSDSGDVQPTGAVVEEDTQVNDLSVNIFQQQAGNIVETQQIDSTESTDNKQNDTFKSEDNQNIGIDSIDTEHTDLSEIVGIQEDGGQSTGVESTDLMNIAGETTSDGPTEDTNEEVNEVSVVDDMIGVSKNVGTDQMFADNNENSNDSDRTLSEAAVSTTEGETMADDLPGDVTQLLDSSKKGTVVMFEETGDEMYCCVLCGEKFKQEIDAIAHFMSHSKGSVKCKKCSKMFKTNQAVETHQETCCGDTELSTSSGCCKRELKFVCDICQQAFRTALYLYRHMVMHTDMFCCARCKKTFSRKDSMQKHVLKCCPNMIDKYKFYSCELCARVFSKLSGKLNHMKVCTSAQCSECKKVFSSKTDVETHKCSLTQYTEDGMTGKYSCGTCPKTFQSLYYLKQHSLLHKKLHSCEKCGKSLPSSEELEQHRAVCTTLEAIKAIGTGTCDKCLMSFNNCRAFREHYLSHSHPHQCDKCYRRFVKIGTLSSHDCQGANEEFACEVCKKTFKNKMNMDRHKKEHGCLKYECSVCSQQFHTKAQANEHQCGVETDSPEERVISQLDNKEVCPTCGKSFSTRSNLTKHMKLHGEKNIPCPHCDKRFHLDVYLKEHITCVHYNIYKYQCTECGKMLKSKTGLVAHTKLFHTKDTETFKCPKCTKAFKQKGNLRTHMYSHSSEKKFACDTCERAFKYPDQLSRHKLEHKLDGKLSCSQCEKEFCREYELRKHIQIYHSGFMYVCGICSARCGHRHTLVRHYKRKHPNDYHLLSGEGYVDGLLKRVHDVYENPVVPVGGPYLANDKDNLEQISTVSDAAEALHSLAQGTVTAGQFQLLQEKGLLKDQSIDTSGGEQGQILVNQDGEMINQGQILQQEQIIPDGTADIVSSVSMEGAIGMIQNSDGTISINGIPGIPQTLGADGQIVILQIVDPETAEGMTGEIMHGEVIQNYQAEELLNGEDGVVLEEQEGLQEVKNQELPLMTSDISGAVTDQGMEAGMSQGADTMQGSVEGLPVHQESEMMEIQGLESNTIIIDTVLDNV